MHLLAEGRSDVGRSRAHNEDAFAVDDQLQLYVVCDGMGGHASGEVASATAVEAIVTAVRGSAAGAPAFDGSQEACARSAGILRSAIENASAKLHEMGAANPKYSGMGTTCVALWFLGDKVVMANVGDSRIYLRRNGVLHQLSEDHTYANDAIKHGMMTPEQARQSPYADRITRALGVQASVVVDTFAFDALIGDTYLLCSDGLHEYFKDRSELNARLGEEDAKAMASALVDSANERGGKDNITALVVRTEASRVEPQRGQEVARKTLIDDELHILRHLDLFTELTMPELVRVLGSFRGRNFAPDTVIIAEGGTCESLYVMVSGEVEVTRGGERLAELLAGQHFGDMALLAHRPRTATVRARSAVRALELERSSFGELMIKEPVVGAKMLFKLAQILALRLDERLRGAAASSGSSAQLRRKTLQLGVDSPFARPPRE